MWLVECGVGSGGAWPHLRNCCSHLLAAPADGDFAAWAAHRVWAPYLRCALWLAGRRPAAPPAGPAPLVPALPRHPHRPHPADPPATAAPAGGDAAADPAQAEAWRIVREGLAACPTQPFTGTLSAVVDLVSLRVCGAAACLAVGEDFQLPPKH